MVENFLNGRIVLHAGDCLDVLARLDKCSIDACVTDPPYGLSFMGKGWDHGVPSMSYWREVRRVLKPGGYLLAFGGTRTYHRMACAIEDAGFEVRDMVSWLYGSGFPKSHDVSKAIDKAAGAERSKVRYDNPRNPKATGGGRDGMEGATRPWIEAAMAAGFHEMDGGEPITDAAREWAGWGTSLKPALEPICMARKPLIGTVAANVLEWGTGAINVDGCRVEVTGQRPYDAAWENDQLLCASCAERVASTTKQATPETRASTATKLVEPTLSERENASQLDTSKPDIGCSDGMSAANTSTSSSTSKSGRTQTALSQTGSKSTITTRTKETTNSAICVSCGKVITEGCISGNTKHKNNGLRQTQQEQGRVVGRWPSNLIHDGSEEVTAAFPETVSGDLGPQHKHGRATPGNQHEGWDRPSHRNYVYQKEYGGDSGSAARFFYSAKADSNDRIGSKHPTIKPVDLMQYLVRLVTPKGGTVLDPFAGTGTTGEAAWREGMHAVLIEREEEYQADIRRRMALCMAGPEERARESIKARGRIEGPGPLFEYSNSWREMWAKPFDFSQEPK